MHAYAYGARTLSCLVGVSSEEGWAGAGPRRPDGDGQSASDPRPRRGPTPAPTRLWSTTEHAPCFSESRQKELSPKLRRGTGRARACVQRFTMIAALRMHQRRRQAPPPPPGGAAEKEAATFCRVVAAALRPSRPRLQGTQMMPPRTSRLSYCRSSCKRVGGACCGGR